MYSRSAGIMYYYRDRVRYVTYDTTQAKQLISQEIQENPASSIRQIARKLQFSNATYRRILRKEQK